MNDRPRVFPRAEQVRRELLDPILGPRPGVETRLLAGMTYVAQFLSHELVGRPPLLRRTPALDLQSLYDDQGPARAAIREDGRMELGATTAAGGRPAGPDDLPRAWWSSRPLHPRIGDFRNDENLLLAQFHAALLKLHNHFVGVYGSGDGATDFRIARSALVRALGWAVLEDLLPALVPGPVHDHVVAGGHALLLDPADPRIPAEFSHALGRFGHSMVRSTYRIGPPAHPAQITDRDLLRLTGAQGMEGSPSLPADRVVFWPNLFDFGAYASRWNPPVRRQGAFRIDLHFAPALRDLPPPAAPPADGRPFVADIVLRNLAAGDRAALPDGQAMARRVRGSPGLPGDIASLFRGTDDPGPPEGRDLPNKEAVLAELGQADLASSTPPWLYMLLESWFLQDGERLGPLAGSVCAEVIARAVRKGLQAAAGAPGPGDAALRQDLRALRDAPGKDPAIRFADLLAHTFLGPHPSDGHQGGTSP